MNNRGFTLIELLAVIVILGLIMALAGTSYSAITSAMRKSQRENTISQIEIAASRYAYDTGKTIAFVDTLVKEGYIESDEDDGTINDPVNGGKLNCYIVEMEKVSDYYNATFRDDYYYEDSSGCDDTKLVEQASEINITIYYRDSNNNLIGIEAEEYEKLDDDEKWLTGTVTLEASFTGSSMDCAVNTCLWTSKSGQETKDSNSIEISPSSILSSTYTFQYTVDGGSDGIIRYTASVSLNIDNDAPSINTSETTITNRLITTSYKTVTIKASDGNGSGIAGYALLTENKDCSYIGIDYQTSSSFKICYTGSGEDDCYITTSNSSVKYYICVKDKVGKYYKAGPITISNLG